MTDEQRYLTVEATDAADAHTIVLTGEADLLGASKIKTALKVAVAAEARLIVIDLKGLTFIDSSGLHALVTGHELCRACGHELRVIPGPPNVQRLFELTGVNEVLKLCDAEVARDPSSNEDTSELTSP